MSKLWVPPFKSMDHQNEPFGNSQNPEYTYSLSRSKSGPKANKPPKKSATAAVFVSAVKTCNMPKQNEAIEEQMTNKGCPHPQIVLNSTPTDNCGSNMLSPSISMEASLFQAHLGNIFNSLEITTRHLNDKPSIPPSSHSKSLHAPQSPREGNQPSESELKSS